ncbi:hypothetical protein [Sphingobium sp. CFD-2]|uniref:hypothetical protein n=1 Tax=Sphingobium sp. CFD-2 TaxID=2878542 RepID=UPI00214C2B3E|nr:hypothetical protein [Sphingobium sp. CFD-2]
MPKVRIDRIECQAQKDAKGEAEIWLLAQSDGGMHVRYPAGPVAAQNISEGGTWQIGDLELEFEGCCNLAIYEQDLNVDISLTDFQGCVSFMAGADDLVDKIATNGSDSSDSGYSKYAVGFTNLG